MTFYHGPNSVTVSGEACIIQVSHSLDSFARPCSVWGFCAGGLPPKGRKEGGGGEGFRNLRLERRRASQDSRTDAYGGLGLSQCQDQSARGPKRKLGRPDHRGREEGRQRYGMQ